MLLSAHDVRGETILRYKVNGSAEMTDKALVRARSGCDRCGASPIESMVRGSSATVVSTVMCIPFMSIPGTWRHPAFAEKRLLLVMKDAFVNLVSGEIESNSTTPMAFEKSRIPLMMPNRFSAALCTFWM